MGYNMKWIRRKQRFNRFFHRRLGFPKRIGFLSFLSNFLRYFKRRVQGYECKRLGTEWRK